MDVESVNHLALKVNDASITFLMAYITNGFDPRNAAEESVFVVFSDDRKTPWQIKTLSELQLEGWKTDVDNSILIRRIINNSPV